MHSNDLVKKSDALRSQHAGKPTYTTFASEISGLINSAEVNANDTVYTDKAATEQDWERIFWGSLEMLLGDCRDTKVTSWFKKQGVRW
jgi:hypothetical protein